MKDKTVKCYWCGRIFEPEERNKVRTGYKNHPACDSCLGIVPPQKVPDTLGFDPQELFGNDNSYINNLAC